MHRLLSAGGSAMREEREEAHPKRGIHDERREHEGVDPVEGATMTWQERPRILGSCPTLQHGLAEITDLAEGACDEGEQDAPTERQTRQEPDVRDDGREHGPGETADRPGPGLVGRDRFVKLGALERLAEEHGHRIREPGHQHREDAETSALERRAEGTDESDRRHTAAEVERASPEDLGSQVLTPPHRMRIRQQAQEGKYCDGRTYPQEGRELPEMERILCDQEQEQGQTPQNDLRLTEPRQLVIETSQLVGSDDERRATEQEPREWRPVVEQPQDGETCHNGGSEAANDIVVEQRAPPGARVVV